MTTDQQQLLCEQFWTQVIDMDWYEKAEDELIESFNNGEISNSEFGREMRELKAELRDQAPDEAYNDVMGGW